MIKTNVFFRFYFRTMTEEAKKEEEQNNKPKGPPPPVGAKAGESRPREKLLEHMREWNTKQEVHTFLIW